MIAALGLPTVYFFGAVIYMVKFIEHKFFVVMPCLIDKG